MNQTTRWTIVLTLLLAFGLGACASSGETVNEPADDTDAVTAPATEEAPTEVRSHKTTPPVKVTLATSGTTGQVKAILSYTATADVPQATARFKIPAGVTLVSGKTDQDLGALSKGDSSTFEITLDVPTGDAHYLLAAGVECQMGVGLKLVGNAVANLGDGQPAGDGTHAIDGVRTQTVAPTK